MTSHFVTTCIVAAGHLAEMSLSCVTLSLNFLARFF